MRKLVVIVFLVVSGVASGQSVTGTSGLIHIPSARMLEDGQLVLGAGYIPKGYSTFKNRGGYAERERFQHPFLNTYITYGILPFVEVMFRYTHELYVPVNSFTQYFPDRMFSARFRVLSEKKFTPSIVFGIHDFGKIFTDFDSATNYSTSYFVISKIKDFNLIKFDLSFGYAFDLAGIQAIDIDGLFYGIEIKSNFYEKASFIFEYDSKYFQTGLMLNPIKPIKMMFGLWDLNKPTFSLNYLF